MAAEHGLRPGSVDFVFLDHDKNAYLPDLESILARGWLHPGTIIVADNIKIPGAPKYRVHATTMLNVADRRAQDTRRVRIGLSRPGARVRIPGQPPR